MSFAKESRYVNCSTTFRINENLLNFQPIFSSHMWRDSILSQLLCHFSNLRVICVYMCLPTRLYLCTSFYYQQQEEVERRRRRSNSSESFSLENRKLNFTSMTKASSGCCRASYYRFSSPSFWLLLSSSWMSVWLGKCRTLHHLITTTIPIPFTFLGCFTKGREGAKQRQNLPYSLIST